MSQPRRFQQVDVFSDAPLLGNPVAVVLDSTGLDLPTMAAFSSWTNLSEATYVGPPSHPDADYSLRIFCADRELPFAGHPTLGSCHAWLASGGRPRAEVIVQECGAGLVRIRRDGPLLSFAAPPRQRTGPLEDADLARLVDGLGIDASDVAAHQWCDNGPPWQAVQLRSAEAVRALRPDARALEGLFVGVVGRQEPGAVTDIEVRGFAPGAVGLIEDPVTGSLNAALAQWLIESGELPDSYVAAQGTMLGRAGRVQVQRIDGDIWIGGHCTTVIDGTVTV
jgi:PhzF family phenazine biosynthesis protein